MWWDCTAIWLSIGIMPSFAANLHRRVVGGSLVQPGDYPYLVSLWYMVDNIYTNNTKMHHVCGGSLLDANWVLTAAHCYEALMIPGLEKKESWKVVVGKHNQLENETTNQFRTIAEIHQYDNWNFTTVLGDVALLKLNESVDLSAQAVGTINIDTDGSCAVAGADCFVVGWGQVAESPYGYGMYVPVMAQVPVVNTATCQDAFSPENTDNFTYIIDDTTLCGGHVEGGIDACFGDSGGPLVCRCNSQDVVSGIVSNGHGCARENLYGIYTRVSEFKDWIYETMNAS